MREAIEIVVRSDGTRVVRRQIEGIGNASMRTHGAVQLLKRGLATLGGFYAVREIARAVDQYNALNNRLSVVSGSVDQVKTSYAELLAISNRTLVPLQESTILFQRAAIAADQLGASNRDLFKFVETVGQALAIQGGNASTARGALLQLSQAIGTDIVRAEEFNSILEGAFPIALAAARGIDAAAGSVARLRKMVIEGEVTSKEFFAAIMSQSDELAAQFAKITPTMAQGFNVLSNGWVTFIGRLDESLGISRAVSQAMIWLGQNMEEVGTAAVAAAAGLTVLFGPAMLSMVVNLTKRVGLFNAVLLANPLVALGAAIVGVTTYLVLMQDQLLLGTDAFQTLGDLVTVFWSDIKSLAQDVKTALSDLFGPAIDSIKEFIDQYDLSLVGYFRATADTWDNIIGIYIGAYEAAIAVWGAFPEAFNNTIKNAIRPAAKLFEDFINEIIGAINTINSFLERDLISNVSFDVTNVGTDTVGDIGRIAGQAFMEGFENHTPIRDYLEGAIDRSRLVSAARLVKEATPPGDVLRTPPPGGDGDEKGAAKALKKLNNELEALVKRYDGIAAAQIELAQTEDTLNRAVDRGLISRARATDLMERARDALQDQLDPLGKVVRDLDEEARLIQMSSSEREVYNRVQGITNELKEAGVRLTEGEIRVLTEEVSILERAARLESARQSILQDVHGDMVTYNTNMQALNQLLRDGAINMEQYNEQAKQFQEALPGASNELDIFAENLAKNTQDVFADFLFNPFEDGLKGMADSFAVMVQRLVAEAVAADLTRRLFGSAGGGTGSGWVGAAFGAAASAFGGGTPVPGGFMSEVAAFDGGGYTGDGPRTGGLDGKGGYMAMVHPQETVVDHTKAGQDSGTKQNITNNFILEDRKDRRTQSQLAMKAAAAQRRANSRLGS